MELFGKMTLGKLSEQLQEHLKKFKDDLGIEDDEDKGSRSEAYFIIFCWEQIMATKKYR